MEQDITSFTIHPFTAGEDGAVDDLLKRCFISGLEASLVASLRGCGAIILELVAKDNAGNIIGCIVLSRVTGSGPAHALYISSLAPVAVDPAFEGQGVGSALIQEAIDQLTGMGEDLILALGPSAYFSRFGFDVELAKKVTGPYAGPVFMALALTAKGRADLPAEVSYPTPFTDMD
ncbi:N-acetyltransferase [Rhodobacteraceae bacterium RKSG542]|uniref:GNAT family N-acetyltransferase n=1 Tax=Pseudovibrio flavus TaxID=2529854 RepID=UPI0012BB8BC2|nr:N-acetyltransferase [Pseudovibrio flavus]MTI17188.1 N-acetyltransferase [Pseudovibrio flavus]